MLSLCENTKECLNGPKESSEILLKTVILKARLIKCDNNSAPVLCTAVEEMIRTCFSLRADQLRFLQLR